MFLVNLDGVDNIEVLKILYTSINMYHLEKIVYFQYLINLNNNGYNTKHLIVDNFYLNIEFIEQMDDDSLENFVYDIIEKNIPLVVNSNISSKSNSERFFSIINDLDFGVIDLYKYLSKDDINLNKLSINELCLIFDWMDIKKYEKQKYDHNSFLIKLTIKNNGDVVNYENIIGNLFSDDLIEIIFNKCKVTYNDKDLRENTFGYYMYEPWAFINDNIDFEKILDFKISLFDKIKNIEPEIYPNLSEELYDELNKNSYIKLDDILRIIKKEDNILNKFY